MPAPDKLDAAPGGVTWQRQRDCTAYAVSSSMPCRATGGDRLGGVRGRRLAHMHSGSGGSLGAPYFMSDDSEESHSELSAEALPATSEPGTRGTGRAMPPAQAPVPRAMPPATTRVQARPRRSQATSRSQPRRRSRNQLLEQAVLGGTPSVNVLQSQVTIQHEMIAELRRQSVALERIATGLEHLCDRAESREARIQQLQQELAPLLALAAALTGFRQPVPQEPL